MDDDHAIALIRHRCGDALTEVELAEIEAAISDRAPPVLLDADVAGKLMAVTDVIEQRLDQMTAALAERALAQERENAFVDAADINTTWN